MKQNGYSISFFKAFSFAVECIFNLDESGFRKLFLQNSLGFGIVNNSIDGNFDTISSFRHFEKLSIIYLLNTKDIGNSSLSSYFTTDNNIAFIALDPIDINTFGKMIIHASIY